jgi:hypothetical protein
MVLVEQTGPVSPVKDPPAGANEVDFYVEQIGKAWYRATNGILDPAELCAGPMRRWDEFVEKRFDSVGETRRAIEALRAAGLIVVIDDDCRYRVIGFAADHPTRGI